MRRGAQKVSPLRDPHAEDEARTFNTKAWSMYRFAMLVLKSGLSMKRRKNS